MPDPLPLADFLDLVDDASKHQRELHQHLSDGFLALAREWYRNPSARTAGLSNLGPKKACVFLDAQGSLVMGPSSVSAVPSAELRTAIECFRASIEAAVKTVRAREKVDAVEHVDVEDENEGGDVGEKAIEDGEQVE